MRNYATVLVTRAVRKGGLLIAFPVSAVLVFLVVLTIELCEAACEVETVMRDLWNGFKEEWHG
jgi:hypothetical protein